MGPEEPYLVCKMSALEKPPRLQTCFMDSLLCKTLINEQHKVIYNVKQVLLSNTLVQKKRA